MTNNTTPQKILNTEQKHLVAELCSAYGISPEEIIFFTDDSTPLFSYEATCVLCNRLTELKGIDLEPVNNGFVDSLSYRCTLTLPDGSTRSAVGVANVNETQDNVRLSGAQLTALASGRAIRNTLRVAAIDLLKLHARLNKDAIVFSGLPRSNFENLVRQAHALGIEAGQIIGRDKSPYHAIMQNRYGKTHTNELTEAELADFVAVLKTLVPQTGQMAA